MRDDGGSPEPGGALMESFSVEGTSKAWPKMFEAAVGSWPTENAKLGKYLLAAAKKLAAAAEEAFLASQTEFVSMAGLAAIPNVRVSVLATDSGGFARLMLDVYVSPNKG